MKVGGFRLRRCLVSRYGTDLIGPACPFTGSLNSKQSDSITASELFLEDIPSRADSAASDRVLLGPKTSGLPTRIECAARILNYPFAKRGSIKTAFKKHLQVKRALLAYLNSVGDRRSSVAA